MRESVAKSVAAGTGLVVVAAVALFAVLQQEPRAPDAAADPGAEEAREDVAIHEPPEEARVREVPEEQLALGRRVYREQRCARCHSIAGEGSPRNPLDGVGDRLGREEIRLWIAAPQEMRPGVRKPAYALPEEELEPLVAYMVSLRDPDG